MIEPFSISPKQDCVRLQKYFEQILMRFSALSLVPIIIEEKIAADLLLQVPCELIYYLLMVIWHKVKTAPEMEGGFNYFIKADTTSASMCNWHNFHTAFGVVLRILLAKFRPFSWLSPPSHCSWEELWWPGVTKYHQVHGEELMPLSSMVQGGQPLQFFASNHLVVWRRKTAQTSDSCWLWSWPQRLLSRWPYLAALPRLSVVL